MAETTDNTSFEEQGPKKGIVIIVISILLGTNALLLWQFFEKKNNLEVVNKNLVTATAEKDALQTQLDAVKSEYEKIKAENNTLQSELASKDDEIKAKVAEIQRLITLGGPAQIAKAKAELARLKEMNTVYLAQIDSLNVVNTKLKEENSTLNSNLTAEQSKNQNLSSQNSALATKVAAGSVLKASNIVTEGLRYKANNKAVITNKAKQIQKIHCTFKLGENHVLDAGPVDIYIRMLGPDGSVVNQQGEFKKSTGENAGYTAMQTVDFNGDDKLVDAVLINGIQFTKGAYKVELYHSGQNIGNSSIDIK
jgi:hypothetical protein